MNYHHNRARYRSVWTRLRLWFRRPYYSMDVGYSRCDATVLIEFKVMDGKMYVEDIRRL